MAVVGSIACEHDASYPFKTTGVAEGSVITGQCGASHYMPTMENVGELAGTRQFELERVYRSDTKGRVIAGFHTCRTRRDGSAARAARELTPAQERAAMAAGLDRKS